MPGNCRFQESWLQKTKYAGWLARDSDIYKAKCNVCVHQLNLKRMGESALDSHMRSKKHCQLMKYTEESSISNFLIGKNENPSTASDEPTTSNNSSVPNMESWVRNTETWKAEILYALKTVCCHQSYKSCELNSKVFETMFPDSQIARSFSCGEKKTAYMVNHGLKPYFLKRLLDKVKTKNSYVLLFDEAMNKTLQEKQLDLHIRFYEPSTRHVQSYYLDSAFMGHGRASDLQNHFEILTQNLDLSNLLQISMDGPNVNLKFYNDFKDGILNNTTDKQLIDIGTCSLHQVHNVFRAGFQEIDWDIENILRCMYALFKDSPARRDDFVSITDCKLFPLKYCAHRWVENITVVKRALDLLPHVINYVKTTQTSNKYVTPTSKTFLQVKEACLDPLTPSKLNFFLSVANQMSPYLSKYQTDSPMIPFIADDMENMMKELMLRFIKEDVVNKLSNKQKLGNFVLLDSDTLVCDKIDIGFVTEKVTKQAFLTKKITDRENLSFYDDCKKCLMKIIKKLLIKNPLKFSLVRNAACLNPTRMANPNLREILGREFKRLLTVFTESKRFDERKGDDVLRQYNQFLSETVLQNMSSFLTFSTREHRLDEFFSNLLYSESKYNELWFVVSLVLTLSHGQASVERGFSINSKMFVENKKQDTYIAQRLVQNSVHHLGGILKVELSNELISYVKSSRNRYEQALRDKKVKVTAEKRRAEEEERNEIKKKLKKDIEHLEKCAEQAAEETEKTFQRQSILRFNLFRKSLKEKKEELHKLNNL